MRPFRTIAMTQELLKELLKDNDWTITAWPSYTLAEPAFSIGVTPRSFYMADSVGYFYVTSRSGFTTTLQRFSFAGNDITSAINDQTLTTEFFSSTDLFGLWFSPLGDHLYIGKSDIIYQYDRSGANKWSITNLPTPTSKTFPAGIISGGIISNDGSKLIYSLWASGTGFRKYNLTNFDITSAVSPVVNTTGGVGYSISVNRAGTQIVTIKTSAIYGSFSLWNLSTPWDVSTALKHPTDIDHSGQCYAGCSVSSDGNRLYQVIGSTLRYFEA
jgi:hypothetical protein